MKRILMVAYRGLGGSDAQKAPYGMVILWSAEDGVYVVSFPEFPSAHTHGVSYEEAARKGQEVLDLLFGSYAEMGRSLPEPASFEYAMA